MQLNHPYSNSHALYLENWQLITYSTGLLPAVNDFIHDSDAFELKLVLVQ